MPEATEKFDAIIIGAGQSGGPLSSALGEAGWKTAIIERAHVGGSCINTGCTPSKTMIASARVAHLTQRSKDYGVITGPVQLDLHTVRRRKNEIVESFRSGSQQAIESAQNVELIFGEASFRDSYHVHVELNDGGSRDLTAKTIVINTGGRPAEPPVDGADSVKLLNSTSIMELDTVPDRLVVLGGGAIGLEFGQMFRRFGSDVTIIDRSKRIASQEDEAISSAMHDILREDGIDILTGTSVEKFAPAGEGRIQISYSNSEGKGNITADEVLVAIGRTPNSESLNLEAAGIDTDDDGYITVNGFLETNVIGIYAMGDINGGPAFTHVSYDDYRILRANLLEGAGKSRTDRPAVYTIFTDPQLGRIGLTEQQAREQGTDILLFEMPMSSVARAIETGETRGLMRAIVDRQSEQILGASILGVDGGEVAGALQIAMMGGLPYTRLRDGLFSHPTLMESLNNLFSSPVD